MLPGLVALLVVLHSVGLSQPLGESVALSETPAAGDTSRYAITLTVAGTMTLTQDGAKQAVKLEAKAAHRFAERTLAADAGIPVRSARFYDDAQATATVGGEAEARTLAADRRLVVALATARGPVCYSPAGPLGRDELDLVAEQFNPQCLPGLLPGRAVRVGESWPVSNAAAQAACGFDGLIKHTLAGKLTAVADGKATFAVEGQAEGVENGGRVLLAVAATGVFDIAAGRVVELSWRQRDDREPGPVNPPTQVEATVTLKREVLAGPPPELADAAIAALPPGVPPAPLLALRHADPAGRYTMTYPRDWHVTGQTDQHLVLRLLADGEFLAQATVSVWKKAAPGQHASADELKKALAAAPGWTFGKVTVEGEVPLLGRWAYRLTADGTMDGKPVVQTFTLVAGPNGEQVAVTGTYRPEKAAGVAGRDAALAESITFGK